LLGVPLTAQQTDGLRFDVVSIKPNNSPEPAGRNALEPGGYSGIGVTLRRIVALAYLPIPTSLIDGGPPWLTTDRFDVRARFEGNPPRAQLQRMMQAMLAERFRLRVHTEIRPTRVFALTLERSGALGPSLRPAEIDCANRPQGSLPNVPWCAFQYTDGLLRGRGVTLDQIAAELDAGRIVVNRTGLTGRYDVELRWTPDPGTPAGADAPPGLTTALREQLGLRLQTDTAPLEHLVIDAAERPTPD
jgi:uncharacterized protein (TIGR03435 family)